jgi:hypothetical protein
MLPAVPDTETFIFARPETIENPLGAAEIEEVLEKLAEELELDPELQMHPGDGASITFPDIGPEEVWAAIDRLLPMWKQDRLFVLPRPYGRRRGCAG